MSTIEKNLRNLKEGASELAEDIHEVEEKISTLQNVHEALKKFIEEEIRYRDKLMDLLAAVTNQQKNLTPQQMELFPDHLYN
jgi:prefoldin subunit 5